MSRSVAFEVRDEHRAGEALTSSSRRMLLLLLLTASMQPSSAVPGMVQPAPPLTVLAALSLRIELLRLQHMRGRGRCAERPGQEQRAREGRVHTDHRTAAVTISKLGNEVKCGRETQRSRRAMPRGGAFR